MDERWYKVTLRPSPGSASATAATARAGTHQKGLPRALRAHTTTTTRRRCAAANATGRASTNSPGRATAGHRTAAGGEREAEVRRELGEEHRVRPTHGPGGDTPSFHTAIGCRWLPFLRDLCRNLAVIAVIFGRSDSAAPGLVRPLQPAEERREPRIAHLRARAVSG